MSSNGEIGVKDDPNGLAAIAELVEKGKDDDFDTQVSDRLPEIKRARDMMKRVKSVVPGVEFSPFVNRILKTAEKAESARLASVA